MPLSVYPRSSLKRIIRAHSNRPLSKNADILIFLDYLLFMQTLIKEASITAKRSGDRGALNARAIRKVRERCLRKFKG